MPLPTSRPDDSHVPGMLAGGRNAFEYLLATLGITQKNGSPGHPQTQGKVERLHQTQR